MIVKMKFLTITGPKEDIDRVADRYLSKYEIHLENALSELKTVHDLHPFIEINPYKETCAKAHELLAFLGGQAPAPQPVSIEESLALVQQLGSELETQTTAKEALTAELDDVHHKMALIDPFRNLAIDADQIRQLSFVKYRYGSIEKNYFDEFERYVYDNLDTVFIKCKETAETVWGIYFVPTLQADKIDAIYASMHFERCHIPKDCGVMPEEYWRRLAEQKKTLQTQIATADAAIAKEVADHAQALSSAASKLDSLTTNFDVRKLAACTRENHAMFYILCGWMSEEDAADFRREIEADDKIYCIIEDDHNNVLSQPPTKLKNPKLIKPFEMFTKMYGLPAYHEMDPTIFISLTYAFIFGWMFGDVGQGLCLFIGGLVLYRIKKIPLAAIISYAGIFSTIFGFLFGSVFGFEDILPALWLRPAEAMTSLPFIGTMNTIFVIAIAFGMCLNLIAMIFHIVNGLRAKDAETTWFDANGLAGLIFYGSAVLCIVLFMSGNTLPGGIVLAVMFGLPLIVIACKEPLARVLLKKKEEVKTGVGMYIVQTFFEMFEVLLSYFSNTLSFIRIGAFAVSHAAMMEVVMMLSGATAGNPNWVIIIFGNVFVTALEGLIVGIQVIRLEYYELFSRFYKGNGRAFTPFTTPTAKHK